VIPDLDLAASYDLIRKGACALETTRDAVVVTGPDARSWLQGQVSQDLQALTVGQSAETLLLSPQGKVDTYCRATLLAPEAMLLDTETGYGEVMLERLRRFRLRVKADLGIGTIGCLMVRGPDSLAILAGAGLRPGFVAVPGAPVGAVSGASEGAAPDVADTHGPAAILSGEWVVMAAVTWPFYAGFDIVAPVGASGRPALGLPAGDPGAFEVARIEAGVPAMGRELTDKTIPQEAGGLVEHTVSFSKGCFTGQELVARLDARGGNVARRLRGAVAEPGGEIAPDMPLVLGEREVGRVTSVAWSPGFNAPVALAYVRRDVLLPAGSAVTPGGARVEIRELPLWMG